MTGSESDQINSMIPGLVKNGFDIVGKAVSVKTRKTLT